MAFKGVDIRQSGDRILFRVFLQDSSGVKVTSGTAALSLYELQNDGTLKSYDFNDNTFKTTALTTATVNMTHRTGNNASVNTALWTYALTTVTGFTRGNVYFACVNHSSSSPVDQVREFQYGEGAGDLAVNSSGRIDLGLWLGSAPAALSSNGYLQSMILRWLTDNAAGTPNALAGGKLDAANILRSATAQGGSISSITLDAGASAVDGFYKDCLIVILSGTGAGQPRLVMNYFGSTKILGVTPDFGVAPDVTSVFLIVSGAGTDVRALSGGITAADNCEKFFDGTGYAGTNNVIPLVTSISQIEGVDATNQIRDAILSDATRFAGANIDATINSRATQTSVDNVQNAINTIDDFLDTEVGQILTDTTALLARLTASRAGYLDNLNIGGNVASSAEATAIQNNTRAVRSVPSTIERPDSGTLALRIEFLLYDSVGNMEVPDSTPTLDVVNQAGTSRNDHLDSTTMSLVSTGRYRAIYTVQAADSLEALYFTFSSIEGASTRIYQNVAFVVDTTAVDFTAADRTKLDTLAADLTTQRATNLDNLDATISSRASQSSVDIIDGIVDTIVARVTGSVALNSDMATLLSRVTGAVALEATLTAIKGVGWSNQTLVNIYNEVVLRLLTSGYTAPANSSIATILSTTNKLDTALVLDGSVYQYTTNALENAPSGGGGGSLTLEEILDGIEEEHGAGLYTSSGASGSNTVNVTIDDGDTEIADALITIYGSNGTTIIDQKRTDNAGLAVFSLDSATYKVSVSAIPGFSSIANQTLVVSTNPQSVTYSLDSITFLEPGIEGARVVYGYLRGISLDSLEDKVVQATLNNPGSTSIESSLLLHEIRTTTTDEDGFWQLVLVMGDYFTTGDGMYLITIDGEEFGPFVVPVGAGSPVNITSLL